MPIKIFLIEDNSDHILLTKRILQRADNSYQLDCASDAKEGLNKIFSHDYDVILCDYRMSELNALDILKEIKGRGKDLPFIVITSSGNEKIAVEAMKQGAYDYVVKDISYEDTLPVIIQRTIERYEAKKEKERVEAALRASEERFRSLIQNSSDIILILDADGVIRYISPSVERILGYKPEEMIGKSEFVYFHPEDVAPTQDVLANLTQQPGVNISVIFRVLRANGQYAYMEFVANNLLEDPKINGIVINARDITERKKAENELTEAYRKLKEAQEELVQSGK
ncbi:MAG: PAS domain S-box protein, partial [Candidatus Omnitrophota bacterium]